MLPMNLDNNEYKIILKYTKNMLATLLDCLHAGLEKVLISQ